MGEESQVTHDIRVAMALAGLLPTHVLLVRPDKVEELREAARLAGQQDAFRVEGSDLVPDGRALVIDLCLHTGLPMPVCACPCELHR